MAFVLIITGVLYCVIASLIALRLHRLNGRKYPQQQWQPLVSVIVAVRNEVPVLTHCLQSLADLDYPADKLQILIVNDDSRDASGAHIDAFCRAHPQMQAIHLTRDEKKLPGKAGAVLRAMDQATGEVIFLTDADCRVPPAWIHSLLGAFSPHTGLAGGFTVLRALETPNRTFDDIQTLDWLFLLGIAAVAMDMNKPLSWMGNNMAFRRSAYEAVGGYPALGHSLIEDFTLLDAISRRSNYSVAVQPDQAAVVVSTPVPSLSLLYQQRRRWAMGIQPVRPLGKLLMLSSTIMHGLLLAGLFLAPWVSGLFAMGKIASDYQIIRILAGHTNTRISPGAFIAFEWFYGLYSLIIPFSLLFDRRIKWKDQDFSVHG